jgi:hypothetical protein
MLKSETWTGTNGDAWPGQWDTSLGSGGSAATIQSNRGRLAVGSTGGYSDSQPATLGSVAADLDIRGDIHISDVTEHFAYLFFRDDNAGSSLQMRLQQGGNVVDLISDPGSVILANPAQAFSASDVFHFHIRAVGSSVKIWWWMNSATEQPTPNIDVSDSSHLSNTRVKLLELGGNAAATHFTEWDNLVIDEISVGHPRVSVFRF